MFTYLKWLIKVHLKVIWKIMFLHAEACIDSEKVNFANCVQTEFSRNVKNVEWRMVIHNIRTFLLTF